MKYLPLAEIFLSKKKKKRCSGKLWEFWICFFALRGRISENSDFGVTVRLWPVVVHKQKCFAFCAPEPYFPLVSACWLGPRERTKLAKSSEWPAVENQCCWLLSGRAVTATLGQAISPPWGLWQALPGRSLKEMLGHDDLQLLMPDEYALEVLQSHMDCGAREGQAAAIALTVDFGSKLVLLRE